MQRPPTIDEIVEAIATIPAADALALLHDWEIWARDDQLPPSGDWRTWLILGGRGAGKTRAGAEWVRGQALGLAPFASRPARRIALVAETLHDARSVMVEGCSGLLAVHPPSERPIFYPSRGELVWPNGAIGQLFSAENPDSLRGPQFDAAWCDELAKWRLGPEVWDMLQFALRLGRDPRAVVTTTPRAASMLRQLLADDRVAVTRARTTDNRGNLAATFLAEMERRYAGTELGRQELDGELIEDLAGALWQRQWLDEARREAAPEMRRVVVGVDPPVSARESSDACGIIAAGRGVDGGFYVLADRTVQGRAPNEWARAAVACYRDFVADRIVAEVNQGGDLVDAVVRQIAPELVIRQVRATRGKWLRAEPVAALYAQGRVAHVGVHRELEEQMLAFNGDGLAGGRSPDRVDALVWAITELIDEAPAAPRLRRL